MHVLAYSEATLTDVPVVEEDTDLVLDGIRKRRIFVGKGVTHLAIDVTNTALPT